MSAEAWDEAPVESGDRSPRLNRWVTGAALGILGVLAAFLFWPAPGLDAIDRPEQSLDRLVTREMDLRAAVETRPAWERRLLALALSSDARARADAIGWYEELVREEGSPLAELHRIVLLAEDGRREAVDTALALWTPADEWAGRLAAWARAAYGPAPGPAELALAVDGIRRELPAGWFADRLVARLAFRLGDPGVRAAAETAIRARGARLLWRLRAILAGEALLAALGVAAAASFARAPGLRTARVGSAALPPRWPAGEGVGLFARGAVGFLGVTMLWPLLPEEPWSSPSIAVLSAVPIVGYLVWYSRRSGSTVTAMFGLGVSPGAVPALARVTLALVGLSIVGDALIELVGERAGLAPHWVDGFQERLVWGSPAEVAVDVLDSCLLAPVLEELLFRGLLYGTLRLRLGPSSATWLSAALFALAHGYGAIGFASVVMSGVLWAVAYERTRSLLPAILAHAVNNAQATAVVLAALRY
jgi:hypothetical protein